jgi:hypothetical protein
MIDLYFWPTGNGKSRGVRFRRNLGVGARVDEGPETTISAARCGRREGQLV